MDKTEFNKQRLEALVEIKKSLEDFINTWCCQHDILIIQQGNIQLFSGEISIPLEVLD